MHHSSIVPDDHVPYIEPGNADYVPILRCMVHQALEKCFAFGRSEGIDMVEMRGDVQIHPI